MNTRSLVNDRTADLSLNSVSVQDALRRARHERAEYIHGLFAKAGRNLIEALAWRRPKRRPAHGHAGA